MGRPAPRTAARISPVADGSDRRSAPAAGAGGDAARRADVLAGLFVCVLAGLLPGGATAHGGEDTRLRIAISDAEARVETYADTDILLTDFDRDGDGELSVTEFREQYDAIAGWIDGRIAARDRDGQARTPTFSDATAPDIARMAPDAPLSGFRILRRWTYDGRGPARLEVDVAGLGKQGALYVLARPSGAEAGRLDLPTARFDLR